VRRLGVLARSLGMLLSQHRMLLTLHMVVLAMLLGSLSMRFGCGFVMFRRFGMCLLHDDYFYWPENTGT
jgi:hypothetical protein